MVNIDSLFEKFITFILLPIVSISFVLESISSDPKIYQGIARLTDYFGTFPQNVDAIWEVKSISNRMINYFFYKFVSIFVPYEQHYWHGVGIKIVSLIIVLLICYYFSRQIKIKYSFQLSSILLLGTSNVATLQAEWWAAVFTLLVIALMIDDDFRLHYLSGIVMSIVFFFKGISGMFMVTSLCVIYLIKYRNAEGVNGFIGMIGTTVRMVMGFFVLTAIILFSPIFPNVLPDIILSSKIAPVGRFTLELLAANFGVKSFIALVDLPFLLSGLMFTAYLYITYMKKKMFTDVLTLFVMWLSCVVVILIQSEFFTYHYVVLIIPAIITILLCREYMAHAPISAIFITFALFIMFTSIWSANGIMEQAHWSHQAADAVNVTLLLPDLQQQENMLYLEACNAPYYFGVNATSRYICALPVQRNAPEWNVTGLREYKETYASIMNYNGKYIIFEDSDWFALNTTPDNIAIGNKIETEYTKVYDEGSWRIWQRNSYHII